MQLGIDPLAEPGASAFPLLVCLTSLSISPEEVGEPLPLDVFALLLLTPQKWQEFLRLLDRINKMGEGIWEYLRPTLRDIVNESSVRLLLEWSLEVTTTEVIVFLRFFPAAYEKTRVRHCWTIGDQAEEAPPLLKVGEKREDAGQREERNRLN